MFLGTVADSFACQALSGNATRLSISQLSCHASSPAQRTVEQRRFSEVLLDIEALQALEQHFGLDDGSLGWRQCRDHNRGGWTPLEDEFRTTNPPSHERFEGAGREAAAASAKEELARLRAEVDEIRKIVQMGNNTPPIEGKRGSLRLATTLKRTPKAA